MNSEEITIEKLRADSLLVLQKIATQAQRNLVANEYWHKENWVGRMQEQLLLIATQYAKCRIWQDQTDQKLYRYKVLSDAAKKLQLVFNNLSSDELNEISEQQKTLFIEQQKELSEEEQYNLGDEYRVSGEPFRPRLASQMSEWQDFTWLIHSIDNLKNLRKRGGQSLNAERWAACEFVLLCRDFGWWPIRVSNSGTEKKNGLELSDAVVCLATVYAEVGMSAEKCLTHASTILRSLRNSCWHERHEELYENDFEKVFYLISLNKVKSYSHDFFLETVPDFTIEPKAKKNGH